MKDRQSSCQSISHLINQRSSFSPSLCAQPILRAPAPLRDTQSGFWHDALAEGHERDFDHLKMLAGEGNTNDGNEQQQAKKDVANGHPQTAKEDPEQVHGQGEAATVGTIADHALTKGPEHEHAQLEALQAKGNADDGKA